MTLQWLSRSVGSFVSETSALFNRVDVVEVSGGVAGTPLLGGVPIILGLREYMLKIDASFSNPSDIFTSAGLNVVASC